MGDFFANLKTRVGWGGAVVLFGVFRVAPFLLMAGLALLVWRGEWLNAVMCFLLACALIGIGGVMEWRLHDILGTAPAADDENDSHPANTAARNPKPVICAMPKCEDRVVSFLQPFLCFEHHKEWAGAQPPNGPCRCAIPECSGEGATKERPLCNTHWQEWLKKNRQHTVH